MLTRLRLQNFRSWTDTGDLTLKPITAFFGGNSSGKTSLLQSLVLLKQTAEASDRRLVFHYGGNSSTVDFGDFRTLAKGRGPLTIGLGWERESKKQFWHWHERKRQLLAEAHDLGFRVEVRPRRVASGKHETPAFVQEFTYRVGEVGFGLRRIRPNAYEVVLPPHADSLPRPRGQPRKISAPVKCYGFPPEARARYRDTVFMTDLEAELELQLGQVRYLGPLRARPDRRYVWSGAEPADMGFAGEDVVPALLASRAWGPVIQTGQRKKRRTVEYMVATCLRQMDLIHDFEGFKIEELGEGTGVFAVQVKQSRKSPWTPLPDVGFGVSQLLPVLALCFYAPEGATVVLEQPELHLHPSAQAALGDVLIEAARIRNIQILLESHSEHLLLRLQRRIAEGAAFVDRIALYFCQIADGNSSATRLELDNYGTISNWPDEFFGDSFGEVVKRTEAIQKQREATTA